MTMGVGVLNAVMATAATIQRTTTEQASPDAPIAGTLGGRFGQKRGGQTMRNIGVGLNIALT